MLVAGAPAPARRASVARPTVAGLAAASGRSRVPALGSVPASTTGVPDRSLAVVTGPGMTGLTVSTLRTKSLPPVAGTVRLAVRRPCPCPGAMHGELRRGTSGNLAFDARQHGSNQSPMHVALVGLGHRGSIRVCGHRRRVGVVVRGRARGSRVGRVDQFRRFRGNDSACRRLGWQHDRASLSPGRHLRLAIVVLGVASGAAGLADLIINHGHHGVVAHTPFTRTIVIDDVTNPWLALLHEESPGYAFQRWEWEML